MSTPVLFDLEASYIRGRLKCHCRMSPPILVGISSLMVKNKLCDSLYYYKNCIETCSFGECGYVACVTVLKFLGIDKGLMLDIPNKFVGDRSPAG